ncbi:MAG: tyrosine-type recombinase/integrase [Vicinamibacterales bacterium]
MPRSRPGFGSVFQRTYRDAKGKLRKTKNWYIEFVSGNRTIREATQFTKRSDAAEFLKQRVADAMAGKIPLAKGVTYDDLAELIVTDYRNNGRRSMESLEKTRLPKLAGAFAGTKAIDITTTAVERYKTMRLKDKAAPATVNRELAALKRMFRLGMRQGMVATMPHIAMLLENNVRKGFFELDQFKLLLKYLPEEYHALYEVAYITGWRIRSELLTRQWRHVDFSGRGSLRLDPGEAKDATSGREFIMTAWLREVLERQQKWAKKVGKANGIVVPWVFCRANGQPISKYSQTWREACRQAGIQRIPHDFRRTAVRNLERAGVPRTTSMALIGHKTESIYRRYSIVDQAMLEVGAEKLEALQQAQKFTRPKVVAMRGRRS